MSDSAPTRPQLTWRKKLVFSSATVLASFVLLESILALLGIRPSRDTHDPFVGFEPGLPLFVRQGDHFQTNPVKLSFFNAQSFAALKSPRTYRIFCMGGSTTYGHPYDHRTYFGGWLKAYLDETAPDKDWEVVNCGGISYASYRVALVMEELVNYQPDLFVIYTGHNEFLEERTYGQIKRRNRTLQRLLRWCSYSRTYRLMEAILRVPTPMPKQKLLAEVNTVLEVVGPEAYHRDAQLRQGVLEHFRLSLHRMVDIARGARADILFVQPAANLADFTPFKSEPSITDPQQVERWQRLFDEGWRALSAGQSDQAIRALEEAVKIDPHHALGLWRLGDAYRTAGEKAKAMEYFTRAKDEDVCPLRALSPVRDIISEVTTESNIRVVDLPQLLADKHGLLSAASLDCFLDHVHPKLSVHDELGYALFRQLEEMGVVPAAADTPLLREKVGERVLGQLKPLDHIMALHTLAMTLSWAGKNEEALRLAEIAAQQCPGHSEVVSQYGRLLEKTGQTEKALAVYEQAVTAYPDDSLALARLGGLLARQGEFQRAEDCLQRAVEHTPEQAPLGFRVQIRVQLGDCLMVLGDGAGARDAYRGAAKLDPNSTELRQRLADCDD